MDLVVSSPGLPRPGETITGGDFYRAHGGKGANQAVAAARLGKETQVSFIGAVGNDNFGSDSRAALVTEGIGVDHLRTIDDVATGVALILVDGSGSGENMISVASGANHCVDRTVVGAVPDGVFQSADVFLASLEIELDAVRCGLERAKKAGAVTILNPAPVSPDARDAILELLPYVDILIPNLHEADALKENIGASAFPKNLAVVLTLGSQGCEIHAPGSGNHSIPAFSPGPVIDTTGAGDCFCGAIASEIARGKELFDACRFASKASGICVTKRGAQPSILFRAEIVE